MSDIDDFVGQEAQLLGGGASGSQPASGGGASAAVSTTSGQAPPPSDDDYLPYYVEASKATGVPINLLQAVVQTESSGNPKAVSSSGAVGLGQLEPATAASLGVTDPTDPQQNIMGMAKYLKQGLDAYGGDIPKALQYYEGGPNTAGWGPQNAAYPGKVLANLKTPSDSSEVAQADPNDFINSEVKNLSQSDVGPGTSPAPDAPLKENLTAAQQAQLKNIEVPATNLTSQQQAQLQAIETKGVSGQEVVAPNVNSGWDASKEWANKISLGAAEPIAAGIGGAVAALHGKNPFTMYSADMAQQEADKQAWEQAHPGQTIASSVLGPLPAEAVGGGLASGAIRALAPMGEAIAPAVGAGIRYLGGIAPAGSGALGTIGANVARGAVEGSAAAASGAGANPQGGSVGHQALEGAELGAPLGGVGGLVGHVVAPAIRTGYSDIANKLTGLGIDLPTSTIGGNSLVRAAAGTGGKGNLGEQVTGVVANEIGLPGKTSLSSQDIDTQKTNLGNQIENLAGRIQIDSGSNPAIGSQIKGSLVNLYTDLAGAIPTEPAASVATIKANLDKVKNLVLGGDIPGSAVQSLIRRGGSIWSMQQSQDPMVKFYGGQLRSALMDGLDATASSRGNSPDFNQYLQARNQYRLASKAEAMVDKSGSGAAATPLDPKKVGNVFATEQPGTPLKTVADAANSGLLDPRPKPGSGPLHRIVHVGADLAGALAGGAIGHGSPEAMALGAGVGGGIAEVVQRAGSAGIHKALNSNAYQNLIKAGGGSPPLARVAAPFLNNAYSQPNSPTDSQQ